MTVKISENDDANTKQWPLIKGVHKVIRFDCSDIFMQSEYFFDTSHRPYYHLMPQFHIFTCLSNMTLGFAHHRKDMQNQYGDKSQQRQWAPLCSLRKIRS